jgi:hypothetical protein
MFTAESVFIISVRFTGALGNDSFVQGTNSGGVMVFIQQFKRYKFMLFGTL